MKKILSLADIKTEPMGMSAQEMDEMRRAMKKADQERRRYLAIAIASAKEAYIGK